jgi:hypothetical protein
MLIEIDGPQHYDANDTYFKASVKKADEMKDDYAKRNGYLLIRVDARIHKSPKAMKAFLLPRIGYGPSNPSSALNTPNTKRRMPKPRNTRNRPGQQ